MAKQYAKLWSGNFYAEVTSDYKSTKGKKRQKYFSKKTPLGIIAAAIGLSASIYFCPSIKGRDEFPS